MWDVDGESVHIRDAERSMSSGVFLYDEITAVVLVRTMMMMMTMMTTTTVCMVLN